MRKPQYDLQISCFGFVLDHVSRGKWRAKVWTVLNVKREYCGFVQYPFGGCVKTSTRKDMIEYLHYAYGG
jgi:hypothetical protein